MKKYSVILLIIVIIFPLASCSNGSYDKGLYDIYGSIVVDQIETPLEGVEVKVGSYSDITDSQGRYRIPDIPQGSYLWSVSPSGYQSELEYIYVDETEFISRGIKPITGNGIVEGRVNIHNKTKYYQTQSSKELKVGTVPLSTSNDRPEYKASELIVKYKPTINMQSINKLEANHNIKQLDKMDVDTGGIIKYKAPAGKSVQEMVEYYNSLPEIEWAEPNTKYYLTTIPDDSKYTEQWGHINVNLEAAWDLQEESYVNYSTTVAVIDSGIIPDHPDLKVNIIPGYDFVDGDNDPTDETPLDKGSHGTHVAGIIGAATNNSTGVAGVNWNVDILPLRVFNSSGTAYNISKAIYYAIDRGADIINLSLGGPSSSDAIHGAIQTAVEAGVVVCAASGNGGEADLLYPAAHPETIAVGAVNSNNKRAYYSNYGFELDLVAPGGSYQKDGGILSTWGYYEGGQAVSDYNHLQGTSMATPYVSGVASLLIANGVSGYRVKDRLRNTAVDLGDSVEYGWGLVDAYGALLGRKLKSPYVFAAQLDGQNIYVESDITVLNDGAYALNEVNSGDLTIVAWRDVNRNGMIDGGDYYGESNLIYVREYSDMQVDIDLDMYYVTSQSEIYGTKVVGLGDFK
jgi:serine protease